MKILFLPKYSLAGPSSRFRFYQYFDNLRNNNIQCVSKPLFGNKYVAEFYSSGKKDFFEALKGYLNRLLSLITIFRFDLLVIEYELFPFFPAIFERLIKLCGKHYIVDYDDAIFLKYENSNIWFVKKLLKRKIEFVIRNAHRVIVGNSYLQEYVSRYNKQAFLIPTVVSKIRYDAVPESEKSDKFVLGWIGSHTTSKYLIPLGNILRNLKRDDIQINIVGFDKSLRFHFHDLNVKWITWSPETEIEVIKKFDAGLMPLDDDSWSAGKCGFKIVQYMACRLPVIASPVGVNTELVNHGVSGFLASSPDEWIEAILFLVSNRDKANSMGRQGYEEFVKKYSFEANIDKYMNILKL
jgi:glycosyltransferase involved in cell wall biosynthesis